MKLSCLPVSWFDDIISGRRTLAGWFAFASQLCLDRADLSVSLLQSSEPGYLDAVRRGAESVGIEIGMMTTYPDFTHPDAAERARQIRDLETNIQVVARMGGLFVRVTAGQAHPGVSRAEGIAWAVDGLTRCLDDAAAAGVTLAYENHTKGGPWSYQDFSQPADIFLEIVTRTEGTGLAINYDTANTLASGDDPLAVLDQVKERVVSVHANDIRRPGRFEPVVLGTGVAPVVRILGELVAVGFDGWICIEEASRTGEEGFRQAVAYADRAWVEAGGTPRRTSAPTGR